MKFMKDVSSLKAQIDALKERVGRLEREVGKKQTIRNGEGKGQREKSTESEISKRSTPNAFIAWLKRDWLMKLGAFLLILALVWFVRYAFVNNWIGPVGRISLGVIAGIVLMFFGHTITQKHREPGQVLAVTGGVMILITLFAARTMYNFFTPATVLGMMFFVVVALSIIAIVHRARAVAILALLLGAVVPLLTNTPQPDFVGLLSYMVILDLGVLAVVATRGWRALITLALLITGVYSIAFFQLSDMELWAFMAVFYGLFLVANLAAILNTKKAFASDLFTTGLNGLILLWWVSEFVPREWASIVLSAVILLMAGVSYVLMQISTLKTPLYLHAGLAVIFLGAATAFELEGAALTIAYSIEALVIVALATFVLKSPRSTHRVSLLQAIPIVLTITSLESGNWRGDTLFHEDFFVILITILSLAGTAYLLRTNKENDKGHFLANVHTVVASLFGLILIWLSLQTVLESHDVARGVSLITYALIGVILVFYGARHHWKGFSMGGGSLLGGVVLWLLLVEVWGMSLSARIVTFVIIGVLLISTAFFQKKLH
jgi:uncharacterized membrane protein